MAGSVQGTKTPSHSFSALSRDIFDPPKNAQMDGTQGATKQPLRIFKHHPHLEGAAKKHRSEAFLLHSKLM